jgi:hypothetical protein
MGDQKSINSKIYYPPCFGRHVKLLVPAAFAVIGTHQSVQEPRGGLWAVLHKEGLCPKQWGHSWADDDLPMRNTADLAGGKPIVT